MTKLKQIRKSKKLLLREVSAILGITPQTVQQMEKKGIRKVNTAIQYAKALSCEWQDLIELPNSNQ